MRTRYSRNRIYVNEKEQELVKNTPILLAGSGLGSAIAECALRFGFENITIIDGDKVELSNLNRQNYTTEDISTLKTEAVFKRLKSINPEANIKVHNCFVTEENVRSFIKGHNIAINALDFSTDIPLIFDKICQENNIPVLHPYNFGWAGLVAVVTPKGKTLDSIVKDGEKFDELKMAEYANGYSAFWGEPLPWLDNVIKDI